MLYHYGTQNDKIMLVISSREFRQNQSLYFDKADQGEQIIVQRGKNKSYALTPVTERDTFLTENTLNRIKVSLLQIQRGEFVDISSSEEIKQLMKS